MSGYRRACINLLHSRACGCAYTNVSISFVKDAYGERDLSVAKIEEESRRALRRRCCESKVAGDIRKLMEHK